jgi:alginate O-acetyltransferase complex protein AlgI
MQFPTVAFAIFFLAAFVANWLLRPHPLVWRATMIAFSLYFCAWADVRFALVVLGVAVLGWAAAVAAHRAMPEGDPTPASRRIVRAAVAADVAVLAALAYRGFLVDSVTGAFERLGWSGSEPVVDVVVPVGISIYVLHAIGYVVDVGRGEVEPVAFADLLLYLCFFPHLVAGPVVRVDELVPQFHERPDPRRVPATDAFVLVGSGLVKAVVIAPWLAEELVDPAFAAPAEASGLELLVAAYGVAVQVYAAFSGATDIAIGCGLLLGIEYPRAFDAPFAALSVRDFWDRWNLTLSHWLRDYVYVPLGGSHRGRHLPPRNVMVTMVVGGLWYGAGWNFAVWGVVHGVCVIAEQAAAARAERREPTALLPTALTAPVHWFVTFHLVCLAFVVYRAGTVGGAVEVLGRVLTLASGGAGLVTPLVLAVLGATVASHFVPTEVTYGARARFSALAPAAQVAVLAAGLTVIAALGPDGPLPFGRLPF